MKATMLVSVSPTTGTVHRVHEHGIGTFCGLDLSSPLRLSWPLWKAEQPPAYMCKRCMPEGGPRG